MLILKTRNHIQKTERTIANIESTATLIFLVLHQGYKNASIKYNIYTNNNHVILKKYKHTETKIPKQNNVGNQ